ncbi:uncharacterized protein [Ptychodera flava]|uniref:uncharacterized protein n=1 Tax=Ptychodera flava TaxID=63121 RepID=UPI00396AAF75
MFSTTIMKLAFTLLFPFLFSQTFRAESMPLEGTSVHRENLEELWGRVQELEQKYSEVKQQNEELWVLITTAHADQARGQTSDGKSISQLEFSTQQSREQLHNPSDWPLTTDLENSEGNSRNPMIASDSAETKQLKDLLMRQDLELETLSENQRGWRESVLKLQWKDPKDRGAFVKTELSKSDLARSEELFQQMREFVMQLEATVKRKCAFSASRSSVLLGSTSPQIITYDKLNANKGKDFDISTGVFVAEIPGIYFFSFNVRSYDGKYIGITLMKNNEMQVAISTDAADRRVVQSQSIMLQLEVGDTVWIQLGPHQEYAIYSNSFNYINFNGFLLYPNFIR